MAMWLILILSVGLRRTLLLSHFTDEDKDTEAWRGSDLPGVRRWLQPPSRQPPLEGTAGDGQTGAEGPRPRLGGRDRLAASAGSRETRGPGKAHPAAPSTGLPPASYEAQECVRQGPRDPLLSGFRPHPRGLLLHQEPGFLPLGTPRKAHIRLSGLLVTRIFRASTECSVQGMPEGEGGDR